jgi:chemotaxis response regulator CheB
VVWGMPGFVAHAGIVDQVLPLHELGPEALRRVLTTREPACPLRSERSS